MHIHRWTQHTVRTSTIHQATCTQSTHYIGHEYIHSMHIRTHKPCSTNQAHTTCNFTSLIHSAIINIQYTSETKGVLYDTSNTMSVQDSYIRCYMNTTCIILHELYKQMQLSHVHTTGRPHNLQRQPWRTSQQEQNTSTTNTVPTIERSTLTNRHTALPM